MGMGVFFSYMVDWDMETDCRGREREQICGIIFVFVSEAVEL